MTEILNSYFTSVFSTELDLTSLPSFLLDQPTCLLENIDIAPSIVFNKLVNIIPLKPPGPEGWPLISLKETTAEISVPLCITFSKSLSRLVL